GSSRRDPDGRYPRGGGQHTSADTATTPAIPRRSLAAAVSLVTTILRSRPDLDPGRHRRPALQRLPRQATRQRAPHLPTTRSRQTAPNDLPRPGSPLTVDRRSRHSFASSTFSLARALAAA